MKAQVKGTCDIVEHIPCGSANKELAIALECGDRYITDKDTPIWDLDSVDISGVMDIVVRIG